MRNLTETESTTLSVIIGQKVAELLSLKFGKDGRIKTIHGTKSIEGLGKLIHGIVETERVKIRE